MTPNAATTPYLPWTPPTSGPAIAYVPAVIAPAVPPLVVPARPVPAMPVDGLSLSPTATAASQQRSMAQLFGELSQAASQLRAPAPPPMPQVEAKPEPKPEPAPEPKVEANPEPKPEPKAEAKPEPQPEPAPAPTVTVQSGDSLSAIAARTLGAADRWREIFDLNRDQISDPNLIHAGQVLKLPGGAKPSAPAPVTARTGINTDRNAIFIQQPNNWTCGPTSLTMAAAAWGIRPANLATINELTSKTRTSPAYGIPDNNAIPNAARAIGLQAKFYPTSTPDSIRAILRSGHGVILNGSISGGVGHFIYVAGLNADGSFKICDPFRPGITAWNDAQLRQFTSSRNAMVEIWR